MKFAVFDVDGTLLELAIPTDFIKFLVGKGKFPEKVFNEILEIIRKHENKEISWGERGFAILNLWAKGFKGKEKKELEKSAREFMESYDKIFPGSAEVMNYLKKEGFYLIALSRAFEEILQALKVRLPFDLIVGTKFEVENGKYSGKLLNDLWEKEIKKEILLDLIKEKNLSLENSLAFGDSDQDSFMMQLVENPVCVQPSNELKEIAEKNGWKTFISINDFFSELEEKGIKNLDLKNV